MPYPPVPPDVACLPETLAKFREHAQQGNYALAQRYHEQVKGLNILLLTAGRAINNTELCSMANMSYPTYHTKKTRRSVNEQ